MRDFKQWMKRPALTVTAVAAAMCVSACGGGGGGSHGSGSSGGEASSAGELMELLQRMIARAPADSEPWNIDGVAAPQRDEEEPGSV